MIDVMVLLFHKYHTEMVFLLYESSCGIQYLFSQEVPMRK